VVAEAGVMVKGSAVTTCCRTGMRAGDAREWRDLCMGIGARPLRRGLAWFEAIGVLDQLGRQWPLRAHGEGGR